MKENFMTEQTIKNKYDYYSKLIDQSKTLQNTLTAFSSSLTTSLQLFPNVQNLTTRFNTLEMQEIKVNIIKMISKTKEVMIRQVNLLKEINCDISSISNEFKQMLDLIYYESQKSRITLKQLGLQLQFKQKEINDCQNILDSNKLKELEFQWKKQQYISFSSYIPSSVSLTYINFLKDFKLKLQNQINFERKEMGKLSNTIISQLKKNRANLIRKWHQIIQNQENCGFEQKVVHFQAEKKEIYTPLEKAYLQKQKDIDDFGSYDLESLKKKLKLLQQAEMSESREYLSYSRSESREDNQEQSQVVGLLQFC